MTESKASIEDGGVLYFIDCFKTHLLLLTGIAYLVCMAVLKSIYILPQFISYFESMNVAIPKVTQLLLSLARLNGLAAFLLYGGMLFFLVVLGIGLLFWLKERAMGDKGLKLRVVSFVFLLILFLLLLFAESVALYALFLPAFKLVSPV